MASSGSAVFSKKVSRLNHFRLHIEGNFVLDISKTSFVSSLGTLSEKCLYVLTKKVFEAVTYSAVPL